VGSTLWQIPLKIWQLHIHTYLYIYYEYIWTSWTQCCNKFPCRSYTYLHLYIRIRRYVYIKIRILTLWTQLRDESNRRSNTCICIYTCICIHIYASCTQLHGNHCRSDDYTCISMYIYICIYTLTSWTQLRENSRSKTWSSPSFSRQSSQVLSLSFPCSLARSLVLRHELVWLVSWRTRSATRSAAASAANTLPYKCKKEIVK